LEFIYGFSILPCQQFIHLLISHNALRIKENFEKKDSSKEESQSFEQQYQMLVATIQGVYDNAKASHRCHIHSMIELIITPAKAHPKYRCINPFSGVPCERN